MAPSSARHPASVRVEERSCAAAALLPYSPSGIAVMASRTIRVTGVSDELLDLLDRRIRAQHGTGRAGYIRELLRRDLLSESVGQSQRTFREIVEPIHSATPAAETEAEAEQFVDDLIATVRRE